MSGNLFSQMQQATVQAWRKALEAQITRTSAVAGKVAELEAKGHVQAHLAVDEWARLVKETMSAYHELGVEWRRQSFEAMERMGSLSPLAATEPKAPAKVEA